MSRRRFEQPNAWWVLLGIACVLSGCRGDLQRESTDRPTEAGAADAPAVSDGSLLPVPVPDLTRREPDVRERLSRTRADLDRALAEGAPAAELGRRFAQAGMNYHTHGLGLAAEACYRNAQRLNPTDYRMPYLLGRVLLERGETDGAAGELRRSLELKDDYLATYVVLAEALLDGDRPEEAEPPLEQALELDPDCARAHIGLGRVAFARKSHGDAVRHYLEALRIQPNATEIHYPLGLAYRALGDSERARAHLERRGTAMAPLPDPLMSELAELSGGSHWHNDRGTAAFQAGRFGAAAEEFRTAVDLDAENATARINLAAALARLDDVQGALEQYREVIRIDPSHARALYGMGTLSAKLGRDEEAAEQFGRAVAADDGLLDAHFNLANTLRRLGRFDEARPHYARVVEMDPRNGTARFAEALTLIRMERWEEASNRLEVGYEALPEHFPIKNALARVLATAPVAALRDGPRALRLAEELYRDERSVFHLETLAMALAGLGRLDEAIEHQGKALAAVTDAGRAGLIARFEANLARYRRGDPCRTPWPADDPILNPPSGR